MTSREGQWREGQWVRVLALMAITLVAGAGGVFVLSRVLDRTEGNRALIAQLHEAQQREREGRVVASVATCAVATAIVDAGMKLLLAAGRRRDARAYARSIRARVVSATGRADLVRRDGTLNCAVLRTVAAP